MSLSVTIPAMLTTNRVAAVALAVLAVMVLFESRKLPLGLLHNPGPAYMPVLLALALLAFAILVAVYGGAGRGLSAVGWSEWRQAAAILGTCAFAAIALERLGYRLTMAVSLAFLIGGSERQGVILTPAPAAPDAAGPYFPSGTLLP